jgi:hypothetical protein
VNRHHWRSGCCSTSNDSVSSPVFTDERCSLSNCWIQDAAFKGGRISEKALLQAAEAASPQSSTLRLAKDITIYDARGLGGWWDETAGASPKLLRLLLEIVRGNVSCCRFSFGSTEFENPPPIMDYWGVTTVHRQMDLADAFVAIVLEKRKPRLIITASEKVSLSCTSSFAAGSSSNAASNDRSITCWWAGSSV